jgi:hypothetical protein
MASVEQSSPSKVPILTAGDISPAVMRQFEHACLNNFIHKKVVPDDQVSLIVGGLMDNRVTDWIGSDWERIVSLPFVAFMIEFCANYLAEDWEEETLRELLSMTQGSSSFWDYAVAVQSKNSLLCNTVSHLPDDKLRHQLGAGMEIRLSKKVSSEKVNKVADFRKWLNEVRRCDEVLRAEREEYERIAKDNRDSSRRANFVESSSRRFPNNNNTASYTSSAASSAPAAPRKQCPKLLDTERKLLNDNERCVKCRRFFVDHRAVNCPNDFPNPVGYKTLSQNDVDRIKHSRGKVVAAISTSNASALSTSLSSNESTMHPVAAVLGMSRNPVAYVAPNSSSVLEPTSDSDTSGGSFVSVPTLAVVPCTPAPPKEVAPLHVPHLYWDCMASGKEFPILFKALIDGRTQGTTGQNLSHIS